MRMFSALCRRRSRDLQVLVQRGEVEGERGRSPVEAERRARGFDQLSPRLADTHPVAVAAVGDGDRRPARRADEQARPSGEVAEGTGDPLARAPRSGVVAPGERRGQLGELRRRGVVVDEQHRHGLGRAAPLAVPGDGHDVTAPDSHVVDGAADGPGHEPGAVALVGFVVDPTGAQLEAVAGLNELAGYVV
jgi:hypothetical protein